MRLLDRYDEKVLEVDDQRVVAGPLELTGELRDPEVETGEELHQRDARHLWILAGTPTHTLQESLKRCQRDIAGRPAAVHRRRSEVPCDSACLGFPRAVLLLSRRPSSFLDNAVYLRIAAGG